MFIVEIKHEPGEQYQADRSRGGEGAIRSIDMGSFEL